MTPREIEKLKAIGYYVEPNDEPDEFENVTYEFGLGGVAFDDAGTEENAWRRCKEHSKGEEIMGTVEGLKAAMADKVQWLILHGPMWSRVDVAAEFGSDGPTGHFTAQQIAFDNGKAVSAEYGDGPSPEAAVDALFWKVP